MGLREESRGETRPPCPAVAPQLAPLRKKIADAQVERADFEKTIPRCLVSERSGQFRTVRILPRGDWMNDKGEVVSPATPACLSTVQKPAEDARLSRLDLANWLLGRKTGGMPVSLRAALRAEAHPAGRRTQRAGRPFHPALRAGNCRRGRQRSTRRELFRMTARAVSFKAA